MSHLCFLAKSIDQIHCSIFEADSNYPGFGDQACQQRAELRVKQEAKLTRRKRESEAKLKSVSDLSRGKKRQRESNTLPLERHDGK